MINCANVRLKTFMYVSIVFKFGKLLTFELSRWEIDVFEYPVFFDKSSKECPFCFLSNFNRLATCSGLTSKMFKLIFWIVERFRLVLKLYLDVKQSVEVLTVVWTNINFKSVSKLIQLVLTILSNAPRNRLANGNDYPNRCGSMDNAGLVRSMAKKGCSPDNTACEDFCDRLKTEMF